jgi:hypothetical protein
VTDWWNELNEVGLHAAAFDHLCAAEQAVNDAKELFRPRATTPAKARMIRWVKPAAKRS